MNLTCTKRWMDIPFSHRQRNHTGHCRYVHGHSWGFEITFAAIKLDSCGFVVDFGKLRGLKASILDRFDHATVLASDDPLAEAIRVAPGISDAFNIVIVPESSSEGLATYVYTVADDLIQESTGGRVWIQKVTVFEDSRNSATCERSPAETEVAIANARTREF